MQMKEFLKYVDISELDDKIRAFGELDLEKLDDPEVLKEIAKVMSFDTPSGSRASWTGVSPSYPSGTRFYRVRNIAEGDTGLPLKSMSKVSDCWEPPSHVVKAGRLNREGEPLLYTALAQDIAIEELKVVDDQIFSLIVYEALTPINVTLIGFSPKDYPSIIEGLSENEVRKLSMIHEFLKKEFKRKVEPGTEYLYRISESIAKIYFDLPLQDAWCYPSVAKKGGYNVCFRPTTARQKLSLVGVQITSVRREESGYLFNVEGIAKDSGDGINLSYHEIGSPEQKTLFPEITSAKI